MCEWIANRSSYLKSSSKWYFIIDQKSEVLRMYCLHFRGRGLEKKARRLPGEQESKVPSRWLRNKLPKVSHDFCFLPPNSCLTVKRSTALTVSCLSTEAPPTPPHTLKTNNTEWLVPALLVPAFFLCWSSISLGSSPSFSSALTFYCICIAGWLAYLVSLQSLQRAQSKE